MKKRIFVAVPVARQVEASMRESLQVAMDTSQLCEFPMYPHILMNDSDVVRVRGLQLSEFFAETTADFYIQISDDMVIGDCQPDRNIFDMLVRHDKDFIGACYAATCSPYKPTSRCADGRQPMRGMGLQKMSLLSGGCVMHSRDCVARLIAKYRAECEVTGDCNPRMGKPVWMLHKQIIATLPTGPKYLTEDYSICKRWQDMGGDVWADCDVTLRHIGKMAFEVPVIETKEMGTAKPCT